MTTEYSNEVCSPAKYLSIEEAAQRIGVSKRSVYGYLESGRLAGEKIDGIIMVEEEAARVFVRRAPGRVRTMTPRWRLPPIGNLQYLTTITARVQPGQGELLEQWFANIYQEGKHVFDGTSARYFGRNQEDPDEIVLVLVWQEAVMPTGEQREKPLIELKADLSDILEWETAEVLEVQVLLHA